MADRYPEDMPGARGDVDKRTNADDDGKVTRGPLDRHPNCELNHTVRLGVAHRASGSGPPAGTMEG